MSIELETPRTLWTVADLADRFGPIPAWRFVMEPPPGEATEIDADRLDAESGLTCELIDGVLIRKTKGSYESLLAATVVSLLQQYVKPRRLGWVLGEAGMLRLWPGRVRIPDACFISVKQTNDGVFPRQERIAHLYPDLAVEILSASNTPHEMAEKLADYFRSGTQLVWYIDPDAKSAEVFTGVDSKLVIAAQGLLSGDPVLPGISIALADLFDVDLT